MRRVLSADGRKGLTPRVTRVVGSLLALLLAALGTACSGSSVKGAQAQADPAIAVKIQVAQSMPISDTTEYVATLKSRDSAVIMPQVEGQITDIYVHSGDRVSPGNVLMQIDPTKQQATVNSQEHSRAAQEANLDYAQQQYNRISALAAAGVVAKQDLDQAKSALDTAQSATEIAGRTSAGAADAAPLLPRDRAVDRNRGRHSGARGRPRHYDHDADQRRQTRQPGGLRIYSGGAFVSTQDEHAGANRGREWPGTRGQPRQFHFAPGGQHHADGADQVADCQQ